MTWLALRYTKHDDLDNLNTYLSVYDEVDRRKSKGIATGGRAKGNQFADELPTFTSDPLNRLLTQVRETFSFRYTMKKYSDEEVQGVREYVAAGKYDPTYGYPPPYTYGLHMEALKKPNWLVEVFKEHLKSDDWPLGDKAVANDLTSSMDSANKRTSTQAKLDDRPLGSNSKRRH